MSLLSSYFETSRAYLIGIQNYDSITNLYTPLQDIDDISECLLDHDFSSANISKIKDATKQDIVDLLRQMGDEINFRDRVLFYFAGHGIAHDSGDEPKGFIIPKDGSRNDEATFIDMNWLSQKFSRLRCKHFLLILDCCFAGSFRWADNYRDSGLDQTKKIYKEKFERFVSDETEAWQVITSASYDEEAIDKLLNLGNRDRSIDKKNSPFAEIFISALRGSVKNYFTDGVITATRLYNYIDIKFAEFITENKLTKRQLPNYFPLQRNRKGQFIFLSPQLGDGALSQLPKLENKNPYKGLSSFESKDNHLFFGRKRAIRNLISLFTATEASEAVLVSGSSGIGKSSLIMAGLIPEMLQHYPDSLKVKSIRPGNIKNGMNYLDTCDTEIAATRLPFILFVDQFEEMVTICSKQERLLWEDFIDKNLLRTNCRVIISMRSDFESQLSELSIIKSGIKNRFVVPPFERNEIKDVIVQPALQSVIEIEATSKDDLEASQFIDRICDEAMQSLGSLPLLSFALERWYDVNLEKTANRFLLNEKYYNGIGGVNGALGTIVDGFMKTLQNREEIENLKRLTLRMATIQDEGFTRVKVYDYELDHPNINTNVRSQKQLLEELIKLRIVITNRKSNLVNVFNEQVYYEFAHDAVLTSWKQLWEWLNAEKINIPVFHQLSEDTQRWKESRYKNSLLWAEGTNLSIVRDNYQEQLNFKNDWISLKQKFISTITYGYKPEITEKPNLFNFEERRFIRKSLLQIRQNKARLNILYSLILVSGIVAIIFGINANIQKKKVISELRRNYANSLANNSDNQEGVTAFYSLQMADKLDPDNPVILQRVFNLFNRGRISFNFLPQNIIPTKNELYYLSFQGNTDLFLVNSSFNSFQVNLSNGKGISRDKKYDLNFPDSQPGFIQKIPYPPDRILPFNKCDAEVTHIIPQDFNEDKLFLMISPSHIRLGGGIRDVITRDTCLTESLNFSQKITHGCFIKDTYSVILICEDNSIFLADFKNKNVFQLIKGYRMNPMSHFYTISDDKTMFAAVNSNKILYVWNLESRYEFNLADTNNSKKIYIDQEFNNASELGNSVFLDNEGNKINIMLFQNSDDYALIVSHNPSYNEFVIYQELPDRYFVTTNKDKSYKIELPTAPNTGEISINYSIDGESIFYSVYPDKILDNPYLKKDESMADSILSQYPSLKGLKSWLHNSSVILSDTIS